MKHKLLSISTIAILSAGQAFAQTAIEAINITQPDLKGTARFMSMGGAFGALGGDLSTLSQNPGGIGIYRSNDIGFTLDLDAQSANAEAPGASVNTSQTKFLLNNIGAVFTLKLGSSTMPNINFGFTYNKSSSFNRRYAGYIPGIQNSMTNYIAGITNDDGYGYPWTENDMNSTSSFDPYFPNDGKPGAPWLAILGYQSFLTTPTYAPSDVEQDHPDWIGQYGNGTTGAGQFMVEQRGGIDSYNIALGGNISNIVYWGMDFDIINLNYSQTTMWGEQLNNAYVEMGNQGVQQTTSDWNLNNRYSISGTGFNYKLGFIVKPIQEFRLGFAFHTPTWYNLTEDYSAWVNYRYGGNSSFQSKDANNGYPATTDVSFRSPWRIIASAAGVIGGRFIISFDYEWAGYQNMRFSAPSYDYDDWGMGYYPDWYSASPQDNYISDGTGYDYTNQDIKTYCKSTNTIRIGAEFRVTNNFSVRAGYSNVSSPIKSEVLNNQATIYTSDLNPSYQFNRTTNYITCGLGWKSRHFYADLAYVYKNMKGDFHAFTPDVATPSISSPSAKLNFNQNQIVLSMGVRF